MKKQPLKEQLKRIGGDRLLKESTWANRKFGEPLPTMADYKKARQNKINEAIPSYSPKEIKMVLAEIKQYVDKLVKQGENYEIFQNAKSSAKALKQIQKLFKQVG